MKLFSPVWLEILSDLFINLAAGWFIAAFIETQIAGANSFLPLTSRFIAGMLPLLISKEFKEQVS